MMRLAEKSVFFAAASALHVAAWLSFPQAGTQSAGASGDATISLAATSAQVTDLVAAWDRPIEVMDAPQSPPERTLPAEAAWKPNSPPAPAQPKLPRPAEQLPAVMRQPDPLPFADTNPTIPVSPDRAPLATVRPQPRPTEQRAARAELTEPPMQKPTQQTPATQKQTASRGQTGQHSGSSETQVPATQSDAQRQSLMVQWGAAIRSSVERRKRYPRGTQAKGTAKLRLTISSQGRLLNVHLLTSSGDTTLDGAALAAAEHARYPAAPDGLRQPQYQFNLPVSFQ